MIMSLTLLKANLVQVIPAVPAGLLLAFSFKELISMYAENQLGYDLMLDFSLSTVAVGVLIGVLFPLIALIGPMYQSVATELRDSLDTTREKASALTIQFKKIETEYGLSPA